jgi:glutaredoxin
MARIAHILRDWLAPKPPGEAVLYTRVGCHLCEIAAQQLVEAGYLVTSVDIDADPELRAQYTDCVPVVVIDGKVRFRGRIDPVLLRRLRR